MKRSKKLLAMTVFGLGMAHSALAYQSVDGFLKDADDFLSMKQMSRILDRDDAMEVAKLAQNEDMDVLGTYLVSDTMLRLMKRSGLVKTEFGRLMEEFQAECDRLGGDARLEAMAAWRSLWLNKSFAYLKYVQGLKPVWGADLVQSMDYNSNASLRDPDSPSDSSTLGRRDSSLNLNGTVRYRPTINYEKKLGWSYEAKFNATKQMQSSEESLEFETAAMNHGINWIQPVEGIKNVSFDWNYLRSYSKNPARQRMDYGRHSFALGLTSEVKSINGLWATGYFHNGSVQYREKDEFGDLSNTITANDLDTLVLRYGMTYLKADGTSPFQTLSWSLSYEDESVSVTNSREYDAMGLSLAYSRGLADIYPEHNLSMNSNLSYRIKDGAGIGGGLDKENQWLASVSLNATWNFYWSSSLSLSYLNKDQDFSAAVASKSVDQWRIAWTNVISTF